MPSERIKIIVDGPVHRLVITSATLDDEAQYRCNVEGKFTTAELLVDGMSFMLPGVKAEQNFKTTLLSISVNQSQN